MLGLAGSGGGRGWAAFELVASGFELLQQALLVGGKLGSVFAVGGVWGVGNSCASERVGLGALLEVWDDGGERSDEGCERLCVRSGVCDVVGMEGFAEGGDVADGGKEEREFVDLVFGFAQEIEVGKGVVKDGNVVVKICEGGELGSEG